MRDMESAFPLMRHPLESNESNLKFIRMRRPTKSSLVVMGSGDEFDVDVNGYHIFRHNATRGKSGRQHLFRGVAIILSPLFYDAWKVYTT